MAGPAGDYHRGDMDVHEQVSTYKAFLTISKWVSLFLGVGILFLAMLFSTQTGFIGSAATALVLLVIGVVLLRSRSKASH
jgi:hypothetical protein